MSLRARGGRKGDAGVATSEYAVVLLLVAALVAVLTTSGLAERFTNAVETAICEIFGGADCGGSSGSAAPDGEPPAGACVTTSTTDQKHTSKKLIAFGDEKTETTQVEEHADGSRTVTTSKESGKGVDIAFGVGVDAGIGDFKGGLRFTAGGGYMWTGRDQVSFQFKSKSQEDEYHQRVNDAMAEYIDDLGDFNLDKLVSGKALRIPEDIATDMGIPYTVIDAGGGSPFGEITVEGKIPPIILGASGGGGSATALGNARIVDAEGNVTRGRFLSIMPSAGAELSLGLGVDYGEFVSVDGKLVGDIKSLKNDISFVEYDENGLPKRITNTLTREFSFGGGGVVEAVVDDDNGIGGATARFRSGDVTVETTVIDIPEHKRAAAAEDLKALMTTDSLQRLAAKVTVLPELARGSKTTTTVQQYGVSHDEHNNGITGSVSLGVELLGRDSVSSHTEMDLKDAFFRDPRTGEMVRWARCG